MYTRSLVLASLLGLVTSYMSFQKRIPNGDRVPFPCKPGKTWPAVGHLNDEGTGTRNPFGRDFEDAGYRWTKELCRADSDGDGLFNGLELGDPNCEWKENTQPDMTIGLSHPGICDPFDGKLCANKTIISPKYETQAEWLAQVCKSDGLECDALHDEDMINITARLPEATPVPAVHTHYICQAFNIYKMGLPHNQDFHVVAFTPSVVNKNVVHHMIVFGCTGYVEEIIGPFHCQINPHASCTEFMYLWTVGLDGECMYPDTGVRIGQTGYQDFIVQYHWSNNELRSDLTDSSGLTLHITPHLRRYDVGVLTVGSIHFQLEPKLKYTMVTSNCSSGCTKTLINGSIFVTAAGNHMHLLGKDMIVELKRRDHHVAYITYDRIFDYDTPMVHHYPEPLEVFPGDSIVTRCGFSTMSRDEDTYWGDGTDDEMCFGFITYHPKQNIEHPLCLGVLGVDFCGENSLEGCTSLSEFVKSIGNTRVFKEVRRECKDPSKCEQTCANTILKHMKMEPCMRGNIWRYIQSELSRANGQSYEFLSRIAPCKAEAEKAMAADPDTK